jgi:hypothetical protein
MIDCKSVAKIERDQVVCFEKYSFSVGVAVKMGYD